MNTEQATKNGLTVGFNLLTGGAGNSSVNNELIDSSEDVLKREVKDEIVDSGEDAARKEVKKETAGGVVKGAGGAKTSNPLQNTSYTDKVKGQMGQGDYHAFPESVDAFGGNGTMSTIVGGDGVSRTKVEISGAYAGKEGVFEYIIEPDGKTVNHRLFKAK